MDIISLFYSIYCKHISGVASSIKRNFVTNFSKGDQFYHFRHNYHALRFFRPHAYRRNVRHISHLKRGDCREKALSIPETVQADAAPGLSVDAVRCAADQCPVGGRSHAAAQNRAAAAGADAADSPALAHTSGKRHQPGRGGNETSEAGPECLGRQGAGCPASKPGGLCAGRCGRGDARRICPGGPQVPGRRSANPGSLELQEPGREWMLHPA